VHPSAQELVIAGCWCRKSMVCRQCRSPWIRGGSGSVAAAVAALPGFCRRVDSCAARRGLLAGYVSTFCYHREAQLAGRYAQVHLLLKEGEGKRYEQVL
jgi:hypothetical protein